MNMKQTAIKLPIGMGVIGFGSLCSMSESGSRGDGSPNDDSVLLRFNSVEAEDLAVSGSCSKTSSVTMVHMGGVESDAERGVFDFCWS
jgi:hypothetical protein